MGSQLYGNHIHTIILYHTTQVTFQLFLDASGSLLLVAVQVWIVEDLTRFVDRVRPCSRPRC